MTDRVFNKTGDISYGVICCFSFLIGTVGNIVSFLYFKSKKRDISNVLYMLITANDIVISITALPRGTSFLSDRQPGIILGNRFGCEAQYCIWNVTLALSVFLVICLSAARTISLLRPFQSQKIRYMMVAVVIYFVGILSKVIVLRSLDGVKIEFNAVNCACTTFISDKALQEVILLIISILYNIEFTVPAFVVVVSCTISVVVLTKRNNLNFQQRELQQSRNRATITILLFALVYFICNICAVLKLMLLTLCKFTDDWTFYFDFYQFDTQNYFRNSFDLFLQANSAANPVLYFWRMPALREYTMTGIRNIIRLMTEIRRPSANNAPAAADTRFCNRINENIDDAARPQPATAPELLETRF